MPKRDPIATDHLTLGDSAAGIAHEISNSLCGILGLVELLVAEAEPGTKTCARLELIQQSGLEIRESVRSLRVLARDGEPPRLRVIEGS